MPWLDKYQLPGLPGSTTRARAVLIVMIVAIIAMAVLGTWLQSMWGD